MSNLKNTISQNFSSDSSIRKYRKLLNQIKSDINFQHFENAKPSLYNINLFNFFIILWESWL